MEKHGSIRKTDVEKGLQEGSNDYLMYFCRGVNPVTRKYRLWNEALFYGNYPMITMFTGIRIHQVGNNYQRTGRFTPPISARENLLFTDRRGCITVCQCPGLSQTKNSGMPRISFITLKPSKFLNHVKFDAIYYAIATEVNEALFPG